LVNLNEELRSQRALEPLVLVQDVLEHRRDCPHRPLAQKGGGLPEAVAAVGVLSARIADAGSLTTAEETVATCSDASRTRVRRAHRPN